MLIDSTHVDVMGWFIVAIVNSLVIRILHTIAVSGLVAVTVTVVFTIVRADRVADYILWYVRKYLILDMII